MKSCFLLAQRLCNASFIELMCHRCIPGSREAEVFELRSFSTGKATKILCSTNPFGEARDMEKDLQESCCQEGGLQKDP